MKDILDKNPSVARAVCHRRTPPHAAARRRIPPHAAARRRTPPHAAVCRRTPPPTKETYDQQGLGEAARCASCTHVCTSYVRGSTIPVGTYRDFSKIRNFLKID